MSVSTALLRTSIASVLALGIVLSQAQAQEAAPPAGADGAAPQACFLPPIKLAAEDVAGFLANPGLLLTDYPEGGIQLSSRVRALAGSDAATLDAILGLVEGANAEQRAAIGSGLARAAVACAPSAPAYSQLIQEKVASIATDELLTAFLSATDDIETAALGAAGGGGFVGGAPALGGVGNPGPSNSVEGDETNPNRSGNYPVNRRTGLFTEGQSNSTAAAVGSQTATETF